MDLTILFMMGLVTGTAVGLVTSRKSRKSRSRSNSRRRGSAKPKRRVDLQRTRRVDTKPFVDSQISPLRESRKTPLEAPSPKLDSPTAIHSTSSQSAFYDPVTSRTIDRPNVLSFSACPACGLETSDLLMSEHFLSSPSHRTGRKELVEKQDEKNDRQAAESLTAEEHSSGVMRNLLSMFAPPRAFGRRHMQQNENPFSDLIQRRMRAGHSTNLKTLTVPMDN